MECFNSAPERYYVDFKLPGVPPSINSLARKHWAIQAKNSLYWKELVKLMLKTFVPKKPLKKAKLTLIRYSANELDPDNLVISFKPIIDGLVFAGVLENDRYSNIGMPTYLWEKTDQKKGCVRVQVEELSEK